jgi:hypothetical protein
MVDESKENDCHQLHQIFLKEIHTYLEFHHLTIFLDCTPDHVSNTS